jgi:hypothetical protein
VPAQFSYVLNVTAGRHAIAEDTARVIQEACGTAAQTAAAIRNPVIKRRRKRALPSIRPPVNLPKGPAHPSRDQRGV